MILACLISFIAGLLCALAAMWIAQWMRDVDDDSLAQAIADARADDDGMATPFPYPHTRED